MLIINLISGMLIVVETGLAGIQDYITYQLILKIS